MKTKPWALCLLALSVGGAGWQTLAVAQRRSEVAALKKLIEETKEQNRRRQNAARAALLSTGDSAAESGDRSSAHFEDSIREMFARKARLQAWFEQHPDQHIPEMQYLVLDDWLAIAAKGPVGNEQQMRRAAGKIREIAEQHFARKISQALARYADANANTLPAQIYQLAPYFDATVDLAMLQRYEVLIHGPANSMAATNLAVGLAPTALVDPAYEAGAVFSGDSDLVLAFAASSAVTVAQEIARHRAMAAFADAHQGQLSFEFKDIAPYFTDQSDALKWQTLDAENLKGTAGRNFAEP